MSMVFRHGMLGSRVALGIVLTIGAPLMAVAQPPPPGPPPYTPAADARDLKSVLFNWTWHMGMLRGVEEHELIASLEYQGNGTVQVDGQPCTLTKYRASTNYQTPGQRIQYTCTRSNGQAYSAIEVVSGTHAWNEDTVGAELVAGQGKASPMPRARAGAPHPLVGEPKGAPKAALAGAGLDLNDMDSNPGGRLEDGRPRSAAQAWRGRAVSRYRVPDPGRAGTTEVARWMSVAWPNGW